MLAGCKSRVEVEDFHISMHNISMLFCSFPLLSPLSPSLLFDVSNFSPLRLTLCVWKFTYKRQLIDHQAIKETNTTDKHKHTHTHTHVQTYRKGRLQSPIRQHVMDTACVCVHVCMFVRFYVCMCVCVCVYFSSALSSPPCITSVVTHGVLITM